MQHFIGIGTKVRIVDHFGDPTGIPIEVIGMYIRRDETPTPPNTIRITPLPGTWLILQNEGAPRIELHESCVIRSEEQ